MSNKTGTKVRRREFIGTAPTAAAARAIVIKPELVSPPGGTFMRRSRNRIAAVAAVALVAVQAGPSLAADHSAEEVASHIWVQDGASARFVAEGKTVYVDPFFDEQTPAPAADLILITHGHERHCEPAPVARILKADTIIVAPEGCAGRLREVAKGTIATPVPGKTMRFAGLSVEAVPAYTPDHADHPRDLGGVGYVVTAGAVRVYHSGSTALVPELKKVRADVALIAFWDGYILSTSDAASVARSLGAKVVIPIHCKPEDAVKLRDELAPAIRVDIADEPQG